jgi:SP family sugar:H+ symporter-like MFS transporter
MMTRIYETKGLSLEQVDELYSKVDKAYKSKDFVPSVSFRDALEVRGEGRQMSWIEMEKEVERKHSVTHQTVSMK